MKFSIIVPVYNIENYIEECINSVLDQDFKDYELILIDDGSTDNSGSICDSYAENDSCIKIIHKRNGGISAARNDGIGKAEGDFIIFLDGDDYWSRNTMLSELSKYINQSKADIVVFGGESLAYDGNNFIFDNRNMNVLVTQKVCYSPNDFIKSHLIQNTYYEWYPWLYVFDRNLFLKNSLYYPVGHKYEDVYLTWRLLSKADKIGVLAENYYVYRRNREGSITNTPSSQSLHDFLWVIEENIKAINGMDIDEDIKRLLRDNFSKSFFACCIKAALLNGQEKRQYIKALKKRRYIMDYATSPIYMQITRVSKIIGFRGMIGVFDLRRKLKGKAKRWEIR